jgi:hypothetical protein
MITIQQDIQKDVEDIIDGLKCPKDFSCYTSKFNRLCRAKDVGLKSFVVCLASESTECKFSIYFGDFIFCQCPLRVYIAKTFKK